jgi:hypothetical protein
MRSYRGSYVLRAWIVTFAARGSSRSRSEQLASGGSLFMLKGRLEPLELCGDEACRSGDLPPVFRRA